MMTSPQHIARFLGVARMLLPLSSAAMLPACGLLFPGVSDPASGPAGGEPPATVEDTAAPQPVPRGLGTLRQDDISITMRRGDLQIRVTPLDPSVTSLTAPDTYERLTALERGHQSIFRETTGSAVPFQLFLVSLFSESTEVSFEPEALNLVNRGLRYRPAEIRAVTPGWETRLLQPQRVLMAVYAFPLDVDLESSLEVEYQEVRSREWEQILPAIQRERARLRARSTGGN